VLRQLQSVNGDCPSVVEWLHVFFTRLRGVADVCRNASLTGKLSHLSSLACQHAVSIVTSWPTTAQRPPRDVAVAALCAACITMGVLPAQYFLPDVERASRAGGKASRADWKGVLSATTEEALMLITAATLRSAENLRACVAACFVAPA